MYYSLSLLEHLFFSSSHSNGPTEEAKTEVKEHSTKSPVVVKGREAAVETEDTEDTELTEDNGTVIDNCDVVIENCHSIADSW